MIFIRIKRTIKNIMAILLAITVCASGIAWGNFTKAASLCTGKLTLFGAEKAGSLWSGGTNPAGFYLISDDDITPDAKWSRVHKPAEGSGVWVNGAYKGGQMKKYADDRWYLEGFGQAKEGDVLTVSGIFTCQTSGESVEMEESKFCWNGTHWEDYVDPQGENITEINFLRNGEFHSAQRETYGYWDIYLSANTTLPGGDWDTQYDGIGIYVNDTKIPAIVKQASASKLNIFFYSDYMPLNPEVGTVFRVKAGASYGHFVDEKKMLDYGIALERDYVATWDGSTWVSDQTITWVDSPILGLSEQTKESEYFWHIYLKADMSEAKEKGFYIDALQDGFTRTYYARVVDDNTLCIEMPKSVKQTERASKVTIRAGTYRKEMQSQGWEIPSDFSFCITEDGVEETLDNYSGKIRMTILPNEVNSQNGNGFIFSTDQEDAIVPDGPGWTSRIYPLEGSGLFVNGECTNARIPFVKLEAHRYYAALVDVGYAAQAGDIFTLGGKFACPTSGHVVEFDYITVKWTGKKWEMVTDADHTAVPFDVNMDDVFNIKDYMRIKRYDDGQKVHVSSKKDVNDDQLFDANDVALLGRVLIGAVRFQDGVVCGEPTFGTEHQGIERSAYSSPPLDGENGRLSDAEIDQSMQEYKASGMTLLNSEFVAPYQGRDLKSKANEPLRTYLEAAKRNELGVIVLSTYINEMLRSEGMELLYPEWKKTIDNIVQSLLEYEAFRGLMMSDELTISRASNYQAMAGYLKEKYPNVMLFSSQLPAWAYRAASMGPGLYTKYPDKFGNEELAYRDYIWNFAKESGVFVYDLYPLYYKETRINGYAITSSYSVLEDWFTNLYYVAQEKKEQGYGFEAGITIQSCELHDEDTKSRLTIRYAPERKEDMGFQTYTAMAYGMQNFHYFTYEPHPATDTSIRNSMSVNEKVYEAVKSVNEDVDAFAHVYNSFAWRDTLDIKTGETKQSALSDRLLGATVSGEKARALVGYMKSKDGFDGYMIANAVGPRTSIATTIRLSFAHATKVWVYKNGGSSQYDITGGIYSLTLQPGEGAFVIPIYI